ncbi:MAG: right-handed parallel beta-helix repeat-containing protein [Pseudomonadota bacterium]
MGRWILALLLAVSNAGLAAEHIVEAKPGAANALIGSGVIAPGDRIVLAPGDHGALAITSLRFDVPVTLAAASEGAVTLRHLVIRDSAGWHIEGLTVRPDPSASLVAMIEVHGSENITLERVTAMSAPDTSTWDATRWRAEAHNGITLSGRAITLRDSTFRNVEHGIISYAENVLVEGNEVSLFSGDGIRGQGDGGRYFDNHVSTCVKVDDNHDDGFQAWSRNALGQPGRGVIRDVQIIGNRIENGDHPLSCSLQGIGLFDGFYEDWVIRDNVIIVNAWHGITVMGGRRVEITDNVVLDARKEKPGAPWITITPHKDGRVPEASIIANNVTQPWEGGSRSPFRQPQPGVTLGPATVVQSLAEGLALIE